jgi:hypothetical protein
MQCAEIIQSVVAKINAFDCGEHAAAARRFVACRRKRYVFVPAEKTAMRIADNDNGVVFNVLFSPKFPKLRKIAIASAPESIDSINDFIDYF